MSANETTRWTVTVSRETDMAVRTLLSRSGRDMGDLSDLVEEAVRWRIFDQTLDEARAQFADLPPDAIQDLIDEARDAVSEQTQPPVAKATDSMSR
jgi:Mg/Co/Ni transporter MgtE